MKSYFLAILTIAASTLYGQQLHSMKYALQTTTSPAGTLPYGNNPAAGHYVSSGDAKIYYEVYGKGTPVMLLHGGVFGSTFEMYQLIDSLKTNHQVIAVSTRGHGKSELGNVAHTYQQKAKDALAVLNAVTKDSVTVLGFSDGGYTAFMLASLYPAKVKKLITIGAGERHPGDSANSITLEQAIALDKVYWDQQTAIMPEPKRLAEMFTKVQDEFNNKLVVDQKLLATIKCPAIIMAGDHDQFITVEHVAHAAAFIPKGRLSIIPNASHGAFLEKFPLVWSVVTDFLKN